MKEQSNSVDAEAIDESIWEAPQSPNNNHGEVDNETTTANSPGTIDPLNEGDKCQVRWRNGERTLDAVVVDRRPLGYRKQQKRRNKKRNREGCSLDDTGDSTQQQQQQQQPLESTASCELSNLPADKIEYYVHYENHDRRLDEWLTLDKFVIDTLERQAAPGLDGVVGPSSSNLDISISASGSADAAEDFNDADVVDGGGGGGETGPISLTAGGNWHGNSGDSLLAQFEQEHEETTKVKNIEKIIMGEWEVEAWYYSPFPEEYSNLETLYVCEFCLTYMRKVKTYRRHLQVCQCRQPPGNQIYSEPSNHEGEHLAVFELDGQDHRAYCQKLCLLAKLFLDHKTLYYDVNPFYFYVVTKVDQNGAARIVGYFSKEKVSSEGYNLACILTFPQFQKDGYGKFIISLSYELTKREGKTGSPEKPLSDLGKVSYRSYWKHVLFNLLAKHEASHGETQDISIQEMSAVTGIKTEDILSTLQALDMIKVWKGQHVVYVEQSFIQQYMDQHKQYRLCNPQYLDWKPPSAAVENVVEKHESSS